MEAFKGFKPGQADIVFISSDRSEELQRRYMEDGEITLLRVVGLGFFFVRDQQRADEKRGTQDEPNRLLYNALGVA